MTVYGWCQSAPGTRPDTYHRLCPVEQIDQFGVHTRCGCPNHEPEEEAT